MESSPYNFAERRRKLLEERARADGTYVEPFKDDDIIDVKSDSESSDPEMDAAIESIDIISAYRKWCGKSEPRVGSRTESIKVSCPNPDHPDADPSAWINTEKKTWYCGKCEEGGDVYDLAAIYFGYPRPGYKEGQEFHKLRQQMAEDFGYVVKKVAGGTVIYKDDDEQPTDGQQTGHTEPEPAMAIQPVSSR